MTLLLLLLLLLMATTIFNSSSATPTAIINSPSPQQDILVAIQEMQRANYFTFTMLLNMPPIHPRVLGNITFLMPKDRVLSQTVIPLAEVSDFLLCHSIPSPLIFEHLDHIPTDSTIPSLLPDYVLKISNGGRNSFFLNNVKIIRPNICTAGSSIRCHGIDGVLKVKNFSENNHLSPPLPSSPSNITPPPLASILPAPDPSIELSPLSSPHDSFNGSSDHNPVTALPPSGISHPQKSGYDDQWISQERLLKILVTLLMVGMCV